MNCSHCSLFAQCELFALFVVRTVRTVRTVHTVRRSHCSHGSNGSHCSSFALFARFTRFAVRTVRYFRKKLLFAVRTVRCEQCEQANSEQVCSQFGGPCSVVNLDPVHDWTTTRMQRVTMKCKQNSEHYQYCSTMLNVSHSSGLNLI